MNTSSSSSLSDNSTTTTAISYGINKYIKRLHNIPRFGHSTSIAKLLVALEPQLYDPPDHGSGSSSSTSTYHNNSTGSTYNSSTAYYGSQDTTTTNNNIFNGTNRTEPIINNNATTIPATIPSYDHKIYTSEKNDYLRGVQAFCIFICFLYVTWLLTLIVLKYYYGYEKVGWGAGGDVVDVKGMRKMGVTKTQRKRRIQRNWKIQNLFLLLNCCIPILSFCLFQFGIRVFILSLNDIEQVNDLMDSKAYLGIQIITNIQQQLNNQYEYYTRNQLFNTYDESFYCPTNTNTTTSNRTTKKHHHRYMVQKHQQSRHKAATPLDDEFDDINNRHNNNIDSIESPQKGGEQTPEFEDNINDRGPSTVNTTGGGTLSDNSNITTTTPTTNASKIPPTKDELLQLLYSTQDSVTKEYSWMLEHAVPQYMISSSLSSYSDITPSSTNTNFSTTTNAWEQNNTNATSNNNIDVLLFLSQITVVTTSMETIIERIYDSDWIVKVFITLLNICVLFNIGGVLLSRNNVEWYAYQTLLIQYMILPAFCAITIAIIALLCTFIMIGILNADFCAGGRSIGSDIDFQFAPTQTLYDMITMLGYSTDTTPGGTLLLDALSYYGNSCFSDNPLLFLDGVRSKISVTHSRIQELYAPLNEINDNVTLANITHNCHSNSILAIQKATDTIGELVDSMQQSVGSLKAAIDLTECSSISPILRRLTDGSTCTTSVQGLSTIIGCLAGISIACLLILTLRAALYNRIIRGRKNKHREKEWEDYKEFMSRYYDVSTWKIDPSVPTPTDPFKVPQLLSATADDQDTTASYITGKGMDNDQSDIGDKESHDDTDSTSSLRSNSGEDPIPLSSPYNPNYIPSDASSFLAPTITYGHPVQDTDAESLATSTATFVNLTAPDRTPSKRAQHYESRLSALLANDDDGDDTTDSSYDSTYSTDSEEEALMNNSVASSAASSFVRRFLLSRKKPERPSDAGTTHSIRTGGESITSADVRHHLNYSPAAESLATHDNLRYSAQFRYPPGNNVIADSSDYDYTSGDESVSSASLSISDSGNFEKKTSFDTPTKYLPGAPLKSYKNITTRLRRKYKYDDDPLSLGRQQQEQKQNENRNPYVSASSNVVHSDPLSLGQVQWKNNRKNDDNFVEDLDDGYDSDDQSNTGIMSKYNGGNSRTYEMTQLTPSPRAAPAGIVGRNGDRKSQQLSVLKMRSQRVSSTGQALRQQVLQMTALSTSNNTITKRKPEPKAPTKSMKTLTRIRRDNSKEQN